MNVSIYDQEEKYQKCMKKNQVNASKIAITHSPKENKKAHS